MPSAQSLVALAAVAQALNTSVNGIPVRPTMPTIASGLATVQLPPTANWMSFQSTPASASARRIASAPISIADLPSNRPNGCRPTPITATSFISAAPPHRFALHRRRRGSRDGSRFLEFGDAVPIHAELHQDDFGVLGGLWRAGGHQRLVIELDRSAHDAERLSAAGEFDFGDHVVGNRLLVIGQLNKALERCLLTFHRLQVLPPVLKGLAGEGLRDQFGGRIGVLDQRQYVGEARIVGGVGDAEMLESVADQARRTDDAQVDRAAVGGLVVAHEGI